MIQGQKSWEYDHVGNAWPIVHAFMPLDKEFNDTPILKQKLGIIQNVECNNHLRGGIVNINNPFDTTWLVSMKKLAYKYAVVWFEGCWPDSTDFNLLMLDELDRYNKEDPEWILAGQIQAVHGIYPYFSRTFIIVNLEKWDAYKRPSPFFHPEHHPDWTNLEPSRDHEDSIYRLNVCHDWKFADGQHASMLWQKNFGATWVQYSLVRDLTVWGISNELMDKVYITKPYVGAAELEKGITGQPYDDTVVSLQGNRLIDRIFAPTSPVYFVNTEPSSPQLATQALNTVFDQYVGCTAGFKLLYYAYKYGMTNDTQFIWFDFDPDSVKFRQDTIENWDGNDFVAWVDLWIEDNPDVNKRILPLVAERWPKVIDQFDGTVEWLKFWKRVQQASHQYHTIDLIYNHDEMFDQMANKRTLFWSSNIYSYIIPKLMAKPFAMEKSFMNLIDRIKDTDSNSWFSGTDLNDNDLMCPANVILSAMDNNGIGLE